MTANAAQTKKHVCASMQQAQDILKQWQAELPRVQAAQAAYKASGRLPRKAVGLMMIGCILGVPFGAFAGALALAVGSVFYVAFDAVLKGGAGTPVVFSLIHHGLVLLWSLLSFLGTYLVVGVVSGWIVGSMGRLGRNRNAPVAIAIAIMTSVAAIFVLRVGIRVFMAHEVASQVTLAISSPYAATLLDWVFFAVGGIIMCIAASILAATQCEDPFCESCGVFMTHARIPLALDGVRHLRHILSNVDIPSAAQSLSSTAEKEGFVDLYRCPACQRGYVCVYPEFCGTWLQDNRPQELSEYWLASSCLLEPGKTEQITRILPQQI